MRLRLVIFFFFNDTATTEIYTLSLHDALPILDGFAGLRIPERSVSERHKNCRVIATLGSVIR